MRAASWAASLSFFFCLPFLCWNSRKSEMPRVGVGGMGRGSSRLSCGAVISCTKQRPRFRKHEKPEPRRQARTKARTKGAQKHDRRHRKQKSTRSGGVLNHHRAASSCCPARRRTRSDSRTGVTRCPCIRHVKRRRRQAYLGMDVPIERSRDERCEDAQKPK